MSNPQQAVVLSKPKELLDYLIKSKSAIEMALPKHLNADRMCRLALTCFSTQPALRQCTAQSILGALVVASQCGLEIGVRGQAYLIPYKQTATFVPGWQGLVGLLNNTGRATAWTGAVFEGDQWEFSLGSAPKCVHVPGDNYGDASKIIWVYACGKVNGSEQPVIEAWPISRVKAHRDRYNKVGTKHYSYDNFEMYARKVVLLQVLKYMPSSIELSNALTADDAAEMGRTATVEGGIVIDVDEAPKSPQFDEPPPASNKTVSQATAAPTPVPASATGETTNKAPAQKEFAPAGVETAEVENGEQISPEVNTLFDMMMVDGITEPQLVKFCHDTPGFLAKEQKVLKDLAPAKAQKLITAWPNIKDRVKAITV